MTCETSSSSRVRLCRWLNLIGVVALFVVLRWNSFQSPLIRDEGEYAYSAQLLTQGLAPYEHAFVQKPPLVIYSYAFADLLLPQVFWGPRVLAGLCVGLATVLLGYIARIEFGKRVGWMTVWLATPMILLPGLEQFPANTEMFLLLPLLATIALYVHRRQRGDKWYYWLAAGFLGVTTLCYKYTVAPVLLAVYVAWLLETWRFSHSWKAIGKGCLSLALGGGIAALLELGYFLVRDGGARLWECTVRFNSFYVQSSGFGWEAVQYRLETLWADWWILFLVPWFAVLGRNPRVWFWVALWGCGALASGASFNGHYYIILMPFWAVLAAVGIQALATFIAQKLRGSAEVIGGALAALVLLVVLWSDVAWLTISPEEFASKRLGDWSPFVESRRVAQRVAELSAPGDAVFIAGSEPQILYYAKRRSPTRFDIVYPMMIPSPVAGRYQEEAIRDLRQQPPRLIVLVQSETSWLIGNNTPRAFVDFINTSLEKDYERVGGFVRNPAGGEWTEPLADESLPAASLIIYRRNAVPAK